MLRKVLMIIALSSFMFASSGKEIFDAKCASCHGSKGEKKALGKSDVINKLSAKDIISNLKAYKAGTRNHHGMGSVMKGQTVALSDADIKSLAKYITTLK